MNNTCISDLDQHSCIIYVLISALNPHIEISNVVFLHGSNFLDNNYMTTISYLFLSQNSSLGIGTIISNMARIKITIVYNTNTNPF